jgi:hypothetical protein
LKLLEIRKQYKTKRNMENLQKIVEHIDNLKEKLTDGEYKALMDDLGLLHKKRETYVKVIRIRSHTTVYTETAKDADEQYESYIHNIGDNFRYEVCSNDCECGECSRDPLKIVEVKNELKQETMWMKVDEDRDYLRGGKGDVIGRHIFEMFKKSKTMLLGNGDIIVYLEDNE